MADQQSRLKVINDNPIGKGLDAFRTSFTSICEGAAVSCTADALEQLDQETSRTSFAPFLREAQNLPAADLLPAKTGRGTLREDLLRLELSLRSDDFDLDGIKPLLILALDGHPNDTLIWEYLYNAVIETTPAPRPIASYLQQTLSLRTTSSLVNSSEYHNNINSVLKSELDHVYIDIRHFNEAYFGGVTSLEVASKTVFKKCVDGSNPLFGSEGWSELPAGAEEKHVLAWFGDLIPKLEAFAGDYNSTSIPRRMLLAQPNTPLLGSRGKRSMDIGFVKDDFTHDPTAGKDFRYHWSHVLVLGELKSNPSADKPSIAMISIATCAREVLSAQDTRRFVFGFTLCGSYMRIYAFDRLGGIGSGKFDINKEGQQFVSTILGFLWMNEEELGFDLTFMTANGQRFIMIKRNGSTERLVINELMQRTRCIVGQATTY